MESKGFANLGNQPTNRSPFERRRELLVAGPGEYDKSDFLDAEGQLDMEKVNDELYALSGLIIEKQWALLQTADNTYSHENTPAIEPDEQFWKVLADQLIVKAQRTKDQLVDEARKISQKEVSEWTNEDHLLMRYFVLTAEKLGGDQIGAPSFIDLISIYLRISRLAETTFQTRIGRPATQSEYTHMLESKAMSNMMAHMMMNTRQSLHPTFDVLEGQPADTDDTSRQFGAKWFDIEMTETGPIIKPDEKFIQTLREVMERHFVKLKAEGKAITSQRRCPVIYTGKLQEMCDWLFHEVQHHYINKKDWTTTE